MPVFPVLTVFCAFTALCSCMSFNLETRRLSLGMDTGSICVSSTVRRLLLLSPIWLRGPQFPGYFCRSHQRESSHLSKFGFAVECGQRGPVIAVPFCEHHMWNVSVSARISFIALATLQCRGEVFLVFVYSNQRDSLVSHCEL